MFIAYFSPPQVCDTFLKYGLPLMVMPPPGVFYPALLATDPVSVDRLAYIMYRWGFFISMLQYCILWVFYYYKAWRSTKPFWVSPKLKECKINVESINTN